LQKVKAYLYDSVNVNGLLGRMCVIALHDVCQVARNDIEYIGVEVDVS